MGQLDILSCRLCGSEDVWLHKHPALVTFGGFDHEAGHPRHDPESNVLFMAMTTCELCGNTQFFNIEKLVPGSEKSLVVGMTEDEERRATPGEK